MFQVLRVVQGRLRDVPRNLQGWFKGASELSKRSLRFFLVHFLSFRISFKCMVCHFCSSPMSIWTRFHFFRQFKLISQLASVFSQKENTIIETTFFLLFYRRNTIWTDEVGTGKSLTIEEILLIGKRIPTMMPWLHWIKHDHLLL